MTIPGSGGVIQPPGGVPPRILAEWRSAEERLYPVVMVRPDLYQRSVELVRKVADELASCADVAALVAAWPEAGDVVYRASATALLPLGDLDVNLVAGAAFSLRYRELAGRAARGERIGRVREAAERGGGWVIVGESGTMATAAMVPWTRLEMHVPSGVGLRQTIEADPETGASRFRLEVVRLDPATGDWVGPPEEVAVEESFEDRAEWMAAVEARRRDVEAGSG